MKVVTNTRLASRRRRQAALLALGGLAMLLVGLVVNLVGVRSGSGGKAYLVAAYVALLAGTVASWVGMALSDRWSMPPRADEALAAGLKGSGAGFHLYNWVLPADHVLLTPWGLIVFAVFNHEGPATVKGSKWKDRRPIWRRMLSLGRRPVREPSRWLQLEVDALAKGLATACDQPVDVRIDTVAVFTRSGIELSVEDPEMPVLRAEDLRDWLRGDGRGANLPPSVRRRLERGLAALSAARLGTG